MLTPADWAGLCALTETNRPEEQEFVLWVIRNRVASPRFPDTYEGVVLQPRQFSAFNAYPLNDFDPPTIFNITAHKYNPTMLLAAIHLGEKVLAADVRLSPFVAFFRGAPASGDLQTATEVLMAETDDFHKALAHAREVLHYFSPVSMKPMGSAPAWAKSAKRLFTPPGIDPARFVFAEAVP